MDSKSRHQLSKFFLPHSNDVIDAALVLAKEVRLYSLFMITERDLSLHVSQNIGRNLRQAPAHSRIVRPGTAYMYFTLRSSMCVTSTILIV
jgi:hypothetical protein